MKSSASIHSRNSYRWLFSSLLTFMVFFIPISGIAAPTKVLDGEWPVVGQDYNNLQNAPSNINASNVDSLLSQAPMLFPTAGIVSGQPAVSNGVAYFGDTAGFVYAVDINTGAQLWSINIGSEVLTTPAVTKNHIYVSGGNLFGTFTNPSVKVVAINRNDGSIFWEKPVAVESQSNPGVADFTSDVTVVDGLVIFGVANTENILGSIDYKSRGQVVALDRFTGADVFRVYTTSDQELANPQFGGGVGVWASPAIDIKRDMIYIGTGQNFETPTSPYEDSLLAINYKTGNLEWFTQMSVNDIWSPITAPSGPDADVSTHANLFSVSLPGRGKVDFVGVGDKMGRYYIMERDQEPSTTPLSSSKISAVLFLDPGSVQGTIQSTPTIDEVNGILYVASGALEGVAGARVSLDAMQLNCYFLDLFCMMPITVPKLAAYDLKKLLSGYSAPDSLIFENKSSADPHNRGQIFGPLTLSNDIILMANGTGYVQAINGLNGSVIADTRPLDAFAPPYAGSPIFGGVTAVGNQIFIPTIIGVVSYKLPQ